MPDLGPAESRAGDVPQNCDLELCFAALGKAKVGGLDGVTLEAYTASPTANRLLFDLVKRCWLEEDMTEDLVVGEFVTLYKNKGSRDDMRKYRFMCMLNHAYKMTSLYLRFRIVKDTEGFLPETQAGFRKGRSTWDNIFMLAALIDFVLETQQQVTICFIDFVAAFDTVSHQWLDKALGKAVETGDEKPKYKNKCRAMFRAIYSKPSGCVLTTTSDGEQKHSEKFPIRRRVVQGDIFSPLCLIIALQLILLKHGDCEEGSGDGLFGLWIKSLEYADDAALTDLTVKAATLP